MLKYINNPAKETDLVFLVYADKLDARGKIYQALINAGVNFINFAPLKERDWEKYTAQLVSKSPSKFSPDAIYELARRTLNDRDRLINEIAKLSLYKENITLNEIVTFVNEPIEDKAFTLTNALFSGDVATAFYVYRDLLVKNYDVNSLLIIIANQIRFMLIAFYLHKHKQSVSEIASALKAKEFRVKMALTNARSFRRDLASILDEIYEVDEKIKSGRVDRFVAFELFLLHFKANHA